MLWEKKSHYKYKKRLVSCLCFGVLFSFLVDDITRLWIELNPLNWFHTCFRMHTRRCMSFPWK